MKITAYNPDFGWQITGGIASSQAGGDLGGFYPGPIVTGLEGYPFNASNTIPTSGYVLTGHGTNFGWAALPNSSNTLYSLLDWFDVKVNGGAIGDGVADDTAAIQYSIDTATASGTRSATIYFPPGTYLIGGALQDTGARNGQLLLPTVTGSSAQITVTFIANAHPPFELVGSQPEPAPGGYATIKSTLTGATGNAAVISGGNQTWPSGYNNVCVVVKNLICIAPDDPSLTFWNLSACQGGSVSETLVSVPAWTGATQPSHSNAYGVKLPLAGQSNYTYVDGLSVHGFYTGVLLGELAVCKGLIFGFCTVGLEIPGSYHASLVEYMLNVGCAYGIRATGSAHYCDILFYDAEHLNSPAWQQTVYDLDDPSNYLHGSIRWYGFNPVGGIDHSFTVNGGANTSHVEIGPIASPPSFATPAIVLGAAAAAGAASTVIRSDATIVAFDSTVPVTQALGDAAATGSAAVSARRDHKHGMPALSTATPLVESGAGSAGSGTLTSRDDHVHPTSGSGAHYLVIASAHATPLVFDDIVQSSAGDDFTYTSS